MKKDLLDVLCCPACKGDLKLEVKKEIKEDIINGTFTCENCEITYLIKNGIPNLLPK